MLQCVWVGSLVLDTYEHFTYASETKFLSLSFKFLFAYRCLISLVRILPLTKLIKLQTIKSSLTSYFLCFSFPILLPPTPDFLCLHLTRSLTHIHLGLVPCLHFLLPRALFSFFILFSHPSFSDLSCTSKHDLPKDEDHILIAFAFPASGVVSSTLEIFSGAWGKYSQSMDLFLLTVGLR